MQKTLAEIAEIVNGTVVGDRNVLIRGFGGIEDAGEGELTFIANSKYISRAHKTKASAIIVSEGVEIKGKPVIQTNNPSLAFAEVVSLFAGSRSSEWQGIHPSAIISSDAEIGENVTIGPYSVIANRVKIGNNTVIYPCCCIGKDSVIGSDCLFYPNVTIYEGTYIGNRVIIHSGTVIGSDGFGFVNVDGVHKKIPQIGSVFIEDDVEIGANVTIDRARFKKTVIGEGTKIDNLVQIAHNVEIGKNCIIIAQVGISGSTKIGDGAILAGQVGTAGHINIGKGAVVAGKTAVMKDVPAFTRVWGNPARPHMEAKRVNACVQRLPMYIDIIKDLKRRVEELEKRNG